MAIRSGCRAGIRPAGLAGCARACSASLAESSLPRSCYTSQPGARAAPTPGTRPPPACGAGQPNAALSPPSLCCQFLTGYRVALKDAPLSQEGDIQRVANQTRPLPICISYGDPDSPQKVECP